MKVTFDSFDELADWVYRKNLAYEELRDENIQLEMDRLRMSDRIAELEEEIFELKQSGRYTVGPHLHHDIPKTLLARKHKRSWHADDDDVQEVVVDIVDEGSELDDSDFEQR